jgi:AraC family transcriptional regulator
MHRVPKQLHQSPKTRWRILGAGFHRAAKNVHMPLHRHTHWEFVYYRSGAVDCLVGKAARPGHAGLYWLTPPGVDHGERALTAYECVWIALDYDARGDRPVFFQDDGHQSMSHVCRQIAVEWGGKSAGRERMLELLAAQMTCLVDRAASERVLPPGEQAVLRAERWMEEHCGRPLAIRDVAREAGVSASGLRSHFHAVRGCSPRDHLRRVRVDQAVRFLRTSSHKLETIAELCGYDSASHLSRCVKAITGRAPGRLRAG